MLNVDYTVNLARKSIEPVASRYPPVSCRDVPVAGDRGGRTPHGASLRVKQPGYLEQLCILAYLLHAKEKPLSHRLISEKGLPGGSFYFQAKIHELPTGLLANLFEERPEKLYSVAERFNATRCELGDASIRVPVLPRVPLTVVIWRADDEFPGRAAVLFDETAADQLPLDALGAAAVVTIKAIVEAAAQMNDER